MHRINRAEIEIQAGEVARAEHVIERLSQLRERRIAPLIERVCSELSGSARHDRLDRLELELGLISADDFDEDFLRKLEAALRAALGRRLAESRRAERHEQTSLELLEAFARTGNLPWWGDRSEPELIAGHIRSLLAAPGELLRLLRALTGDSLSLERLARHCEGTLLEAIVERVHPGIHARVSAGVQELGRLLRQSSDSADPGRLAVRLSSAVLSAVARIDVHEPELLLRAVVRELLVSWPQALPLLESAMRRGTEPSWLLGPMRDAGVSLVGVVEKAGAGNDASPRTVPAEEPEVGRKAVLADSSIASEGLRPEPASDPDWLPVHERPLRREPSFRGERREHLSREPVSTDGSRESRSIQASRRRALEQLEQLYVDDAGLVILWPFLERFFARVGLLDEHRRFLDEQAPMQAVSLLEQTAIEDPEPPEYRLPLAKLLCGMAPEAGFVLERSLAPEQLSECDRLLTAVIDHAPILRGMTVASFRTTFLQRPGVLSIRDGAWLLQVERHAHDLVLERFPWSWSWVKLPWMPDPLRVEW